MRPVPFLAILILTTAPVLAQNPQMAPPQNPVVPVAPPNAASPPPERIAPGTGTSGTGTSGTGTSGTGSLSDSLSRQHGTITPPRNVDPGMAVAPQSDGIASTPVIPPPGSPGGNQSVVPK